MDVRYVLESIGLLITYLAFDGGSDPNSPLQLLGLSRGAMVCACVLPASAAALCSPSLF
jgi:hypothetical protein